MKGVSLAKVGTISQSEFSKGACKVLPLVPYATIDFVGDNGRFHV